MPEHAHVRFVPGGAAADVALGVTVLEAARAAGVLIPAPCGGKGACGRCAVAVTDGVLEAASEQELVALRRARVDASRIRLACMARVCGPVSVRPLAVSSAEVAPVRASASAPERLVAGIDLGTTTVSAQVVCITSGVTAGVGRVLNRQALYGADVLSRISAALDGKAGELQEAAERSVLDALAAARAVAGVPEAPIERIVVAGNTAMLSLLSGADVGGLASHPFVHALPPDQRIVSDRLLTELAAAEIVVLPPIAAFVGGDLVAGMLSEGMAGEAEGSLLVDMGTNAEVAAVGHERVMAASAPAGPAFEGWGIACGGQAGDGGVVRIEVGAEGEPIPVTIHGDPTHLTGSGLISAVAFLRRGDHLDVEGLLNPRGAVAKRLFDVEGVRAVSLCADPRDRSVFLTQLDIRALQSAKAAVCVALRSVALSAGLVGEAVRRFVVTGGFGGAVDSRDLVELGIVPRDVEEVLEHVSDAALRGAAAAALDPSLLEDARALVARTRYIDLAAGESFAEEFVRSTRLEPFVL